MFEKFSDAEEAEAQSFVVETIFGVGMKKSGDSKRIGIVLQGGVKWLFEDVKRIHTSVVDNSLTPRNSF